MASDFCKGGEGSGRLRAGAREAGGEGAHGGDKTSAWAPRGESKIERPCVSSQAPGGRALGSILFGGILVGTSCSQEQCLDFFLSSSF